MGRTETAEFTILCLIQDGEKILLQNRVKEDWKGYTLPGGHVEIGTVDDFEDLLDVMNNPDLTEFQYLVDGDDWNVLKK